MNKIKVWDYFPQPPVGKIYHFHYKDCGSMPDTTAPVKLNDMYSLFLTDPDTKSVLYIDYDNNMKWKDTWYLQYKDGYGIAEWRDDNIVEKNNWSTKIFGKRNKIVFKKDYPIWWGDYCNVGVSYQNKPSSEFLYCNPPQAINGTQTFCIEREFPSFTLSNGDTYNDVISLVYQQSWGKNTGGARYLFAKGIGPISVQWIAPDITDKSRLIITNRLDAKFTIIDGYKKDVQT